MKLAFVYDNGKTFTATSVTEYEFYNVPKFKKEVTTILKQMGIKN